MAARALVYELYILHVQNACFNFPLGKTNFIILVGKALPRLPHICKRNTATFIRQISATLQVTPKRTLGLEEHQRPSSESLLLKVSTMRPRAGRGTPTKARVTALGRAREPESLHSHSYLLLRDIQLATGRHSPTCVYTSKCQPEFTFLFPL